MKTIGWAEIAKELGCSVQCARNRAARAGIKPVKKTTGGRRSERTLFRVSDLPRFGPPKQVLKGAKR